MQTAFPAEDKVGSDEIHEGLEKVLKVSEYLNFPFTVDEVAAYFLPKAKLTGEQLRTILKTHDFEDIPFQVKDGYLLASGIQSDTSRSEREQMSAAKLDSAMKFAKVLTRLVPFIRTVAVTGSVAYGSANKWDDIDLFIVTQRNRLWLTAFMTLVLVRLNKLLGLSPPYLSLFCLSYVHDQEGFEKESYLNRTNPLFARELLKAKPVAGSDQYRRLLERNDWVAGLYSVPYAAKLQDLGEISGQTVEVDSDPTRVSFLLNWAEGIVFPLLRCYLSIRAYLTNLKLSSRGQNLRVFSTKMSPVSCVYTSKFYEWLLALWGE